ncbi:hypothetical protein EPJ79_09210 [Brachyspira aalborgi]|uniref:Lipoprotein n=1 Tax=Brachyspira aalborgi TaxID=29522 RepID=A0A5C8D882_9SPIR|nr:hypothetical protein [Brachyspira aalborgi]TXJ21283.1 hypothetical protein EPJ79_09210 [Brachyspira aalborgi]
MNNTKTIFKSLLIMIVAISLFTVSCSKDEGGTKNPTNPTIVKVSAQNITDTLKGLGQLKDTDQTQTLILDFGTMSEPANGSANIANANKSFAKVKTALTTVFGTPQTILTVTTDLESKNKPTDNAALEVNITFKANSGFEFDESITGAGKTTYTYNASDKSAKLTLKITPDQNWVD